MNTLYHAPGDGAREMHIEGEQEPPTCVSGFTKREEWTLVSPSPAPPLHWIYWAQYSICEGEMQGGKKRHPAGVLGVILPQGASARR